MTFFVLHLALALTALAAPGHSAQTPAPPASPASPTAAAAETTAAWRVRRERELREPDGWLAVAGLFFLQPGRNAVGTAPGSVVALPAGRAPDRVGTLTYGEGRVWFEPLPGVAARVSDRPAAGRVELRLANAAEKQPADRVSVGGVSFHLHRSGDRLGVRLRDPESDIRARFQGLTWYPVDPRYTITGRFVRYETPRDIGIENVLGDIDVSKAPGEVEFAVDGRTVRLVAMSAGKRLWFIFRDATAPAETYRIRFLYADAPAADGRVTLDFNRAYNPPCAYNPHTTCPLPPAQNRLGVRIPAGEKRYTAAAPAKPHS